MKRNERKREREWESLCDDCTWYTATSYIVRDMCASFWYVNIHRAHSLSALCYSFIASLGRQTIHTFNHVTQILSSNTYMCTFFGLKAHFNGRTNTFLHESLPHLCFGTMHMIRTCCSFTLRETDMKRTLQNVTCVLMLLPCHILKCWICLCREKHHPFRIDWMA